MEVRVLGCLGLVGSQQAKDKEYYGIDCYGIVEQNTDDLLDEFDRFGVKACRRVVGFWRIERKNQQQGGSRNVGHIGSRQVQGVEIFAELMECRTA